MQCSQPFCGTGFPLNFGPAYPAYNFGFPQVHQSLYPEIIGEGEVASVIFPDGNVRLYFIPLNKRCAHNYHYNSTSFCNNAMGAYYVRGISNPITPAVFSQQCQKMYSSPNQRPFYNSDCNLNIPSPGFQLKFHNDCWTSTTDLQYFFPRLRQCDWYQTQTKTCAAVQVDVPVKECAIIHQEIVCAKPCLCEDKYCSECESADECFESKDSKRNIKSKAIRQKEQHFENKRGNRLCHCRKAHTTDKSITTVADQCSSCAGEKERVTQTCPTAYSAATSFQSVNDCLNRNDVKTEIWIPKTSLCASGNEMSRKSSQKIIGIYEIGSSTCSCSEIGE